MSIRRKKSYADAVVQGALLRRLACHWALFLFANLMALTGWRILVTDPFGDWAQHQQALFNAYVPCIFVSLALLPAFIWDSLKLSNRFAGPVVRLRSALKALAEGREVQPLSFRKGDFWMSLADDFNAVLRRIGEHPDAVGEEFVATRLIEDGEHQTRDAESVRDA